MQLADELQAKQAMTKADLECWKKLEEQFEQIHGLFLFDLDVDDQEKACRDACTRERDNADVSQMAQEMDMSPYSPSPSPSLLGSHTKDSQRKWRGERRTYTGRNLRPNIGRVTNLNKEVAEDTCTKPHSCIGCIIINNNNIIDDSNEVRSALKVVASACLVLTSNTRVVSLP